MLKFPKILYFIKDGVPTDEEIKDSYRYGGGVVFRNACFVPAVGSLEACDGVAGAVPKRYADKFPPGKKALKNYLDTLNVGQFDDERPEPPADPEPEPPPKAPEKKADVIWKPNA